MQYHFAFMAVSLALFGMSVGAIVVYLRRDYFAPKDVSQLLSASTLLFSLTIVVSTILHINIRLSNDHILLPLLANFVVISVPFIFSGISVSLALTKFPKQVDKLYAVDLIGASLGCFALIYVLKFTDGVTAVFISAGFACLGAYFFSRASRNVKLTRVLAAFSVLLIGFTSVQIVLVQQQTPLIKLKWMKGELEPSLLVEKWNSFSRVRVWENPLFTEVPFGWGLSDTYPKVHVDQLYMDIDSMAATILTAFDGDLEKVGYLKYDVTNLVHYLRHDSNVLIVGTGDGRDILSAMAFGQKSITGVEINENIIDLVTKNFGDFTGHLDQYPNVTFVNDEARSYISRSKDLYDIIQISLIDTWAATTAGAFVLAENSLYTVEAWQTFYDHLSEDGILSLSRWYFRDQPGEMYRLAGLATETLQQAGIQNPREHILIVRYLPGDGGDGTPEGVGTLLLSKAPFSAEAMRTIHDIANSMNFDIVFSPTESLDPTFNQIVSAPDRRAFYNSFPLNISPPTDDSPYFFNMLRLRDIGGKALWQQGSMTFNLVLLFGALVLFGTLTPWVLANFIASVTPIRILAAVGLLFPLGLFMGMAFPLGMKLASMRAATITPWLWGMNGAASVLSSVLATAIGLNFSISASFWCGVVCYAVATSAYAWNILRQGETIRFKAITSPVGK